MLKFLTREIRPLWTRWPQGPTRTRWVEFIGIFREIPDSASANIFSVKNVWNTVLHPGNQSVRVVTYNNSPKKVVYLALLLVSTLDQGFLPLVNLWPFHSLKGWCISDLQNGGIKRSPFITSQFSGISKVLLPSTGRGAGRSTEFITWVRYGKTNFLTPFQQPSFLGGRRRCFVVIFEHKLNLGRALNGDSLNRRPVMATRLIATACWHVSISFNRFRKKNNVDRVWVGLCLEDSRLVDSERILENSRIAKAMMRKYYNMF